MSLTNSYATEAELRLHMGDDGNVAPQSLLEEALDAASRQIDHFCGRKFWLDSTVTIRKYRTEDPEMAWVDDIGSTSGLLVATDPLDDGVFSESWTIDTDFELEPEDADSAGAGSAYAWWRIRAIGEKLFPTTGKRRRLQVTALHGWSAVPPDVKKACLLRAYALYKRRETPTGIQGFEGFGMRTTRSDPDVQHLLMPLQKIYIGAV